MDGGSPPRPVWVERLWLDGFRCFSELDLALDPGLTVLRGDNGQGKTSVLEAVGWVARTRSFRGVPDQVLVRAGRERAVVRAEIADEERHRLFEAEIVSGGRNRVMVDRNPVARTRDLVGLLRVSVFAPDDLQLVKGGPSERRGYLDDLLVSITPRYDAARADFERVLKQRNALLKSGARGPDGASTLAVFDEQLVRAGAELVRGRVRLATRLTAAVDAAYAGLAGGPGPVEARYEAEWAEGALGEDALDDVEPALRRALETSRAKEVDRGITLVGPHRDEWRLRIGELDARTHASQGEQRSLSLALRLGGHEVVTEITGATPVLLLDDVFSELDPSRAAALVQRLPSGQTLLTTASDVPEAVAPDRVLRIDAGVVVAEPT